MADRPSAFSDSPEDRIRKVRELVEDPAAVSERLKAPVAVPASIAHTLLDLCRDLEKERVDRVTYTNLSHEAMASERRALVALQEAKGQIKAAEDRAEGLARALSEVEAHPARYFARRVLARAQPHLPLPVQAFVSALFEKGTGAP